ncbi:uncharacterized protein [Porites lutea]|uniref:uncharacterized protein n=1 Tax=Porites lutea TaxID=51062 RepID=UPI003CC6C324
MERKHNSAAKLSLFVSFLFVLQFRWILAETYEKIDNCSCRKSNGKVISLREIDGPSGPAFKGIPTKAPYHTTLVFDWNPCTKFSEGSSCIDLLICQKFSLSPENTFPCGDTVGSFEVNSEGNTVMNYEPVVDATGYKRTFKITLKCDPGKFPGYTDGVTEVYTPLTSEYSMTFSSKCACDDGCFKQSS